MVGMEVSLGISCVLGAVAILLFYWFSTRNRDYWKNQGIPYIKPLPFIGCLYHYFKKPAHEVETEHYLKYGPIYGYHIGTKPLLSVADPELLREIFVKEFSKFNSRQVFEFHDDIFNKALANMKGDEDWKRIRSIITPTFTTGKIKRLLGILKECSRTIVKNFEAASSEGKAVDAKRMYGAFSIDVIASAAFSTKLDSHNDPDNPFVKYAGKVFNRSMHIGHAILLLFPSLAILLNIKFIPADVTEFYTKVVVEIIEERNRTGQTRNDFLQLLMDTAKEVEEEDIFDFPSEGADIATNYGAQEDINPHIYKSVTSKHLSMEEIVAQCVSFFMAGYDTTATTLSCASYLLALNLQAQDRLRQELEEAVRESQGELSYDTIQSMKYLDNVISETLRLYPPIMRLERTPCVDHKLGNTAVTVTKGMQLSIPICAMHRDPKIFPEPEKFDPERFTPEERAKRDSFTYLPFGAGPRNCVAMRFALMEVKVCLAHVIANFNIKRCPDTKVPLEFGRGQVVIQPNGILLEMERRSDPIIFK